MHTRLSCKIDYLLSSNHRDGLIALPDSTAALLLVLGGTLEVLGPVCILLDFYRRQAALLFVFYVVATAVLFHKLLELPLQRRRLESEFLAVP